MQSSERTRIALRRAERSAAPILAHLGGAVPSFFGNDFWAGTRKLSLTISVKVHLAGIAELLLPDQQPATTASCLGDGWQSIAEGRLIGTTRMGRMANS